MIYYVIVYNLYTIYRAIQLLFMQFMYFIYRFENCLCIVRKVQENGGYFRIIVCRKSSKIAIFSQFGFREISYALLSEIYILLPGLFYTIIFIDFTTLHVVLKTISHSLNKTKMRNYYKTTHFFKPQYGGRFTFFNILCLLIYHGCVPLTTQF